MHYAFLLDMNGFYRDLMSLITNLTNRASDIVMYGTFHKQRAISVPNWTDAKNLQNIEIYRPYACFAYSHIIGGHKKPEKVTRSHCYGRFKPSKHPIFYPVFVPHAKQYFCLDFSRQS